MENTQQEQKEMTKHEALEAMRSGEKVTHNLFTSDEWATMKGGVITTEDGVIHPNFWAYKTKPCWETGWSIFQEPNP